ncbi:MAG: 4Fe-4S dicluster domain-containing protein [Deltaproteobacteria bacterium]|nr:4Fe-4S dicluster domain-containing protein [Deltaproteobacteria bacterium]
MWADRIRIDEARCIQCGDCAKACMEENPERHALTTIVQERFRAIRSEEAIAEPTRLQEVLAMDTAEREKFWHDQFRKCIKCYGCIDMCPVYPEEPDGLDPSDWVEGGQVPPRYPHFHLLRAYQVWDTCVLCGECEQTCPANIPLKMLQDIVRHLPPEKVFEVIPGMENEAQEAISGFVNRRKASSRRIRDAA